MRYFVKPNQTVIERVIYYSILIRNIRITLLQIRKTMLMVRGLDIQNLTINDLKENELVLLHAIDEIQAACKQMLSPIFENIDFGHDYTNHWAIPMNDIKNGYCELEEIIQFKEGKPIVFGRKYILLLYDYIDPTLGKFYGGELIPLHKAIHFIDNIPKQQDKVKGLYDAIINSLVLATRTRNSNQL